MAELKDEPVVENNYKKLQKKRLMINTIIVSLMLIITLSILIPTVIVPYARGYKTKGNTLVSVVSKNVASVTIKEGITEIKAQAFKDCSSLTKITIPNSVTKIGSEAFSGCSLLEKIIIPQNAVYEPGYSSQGAFEYCSNLKEIECPASFIWRIPESVEKIVVNGGETIPVAGAMNSKNLTSLSIKESVVTIEEMAFFGCKNLKDVTFAVNGNLKTIGSKAFSECDSLTTISLPSKVSDISYDDSIGKKWGAFTECPNLSNISISDVNQTFTSANSNCVIRKDTNELVFGGTKTVIPETVNTIGQDAFKGNNISSIVIPDSVENIKMDAFQDCSCLESIIFSANSNLTTIGIGAFAGCTKLKEIKIPMTVTSISGVLFDKCESLEYIEMPAYNKEYAHLFDSGKDNDKFYKVTTKEMRQGIGKIYYKYYDYYVPKSLKTIKIISGTSIADHAFDGWTYLENVIIDADVTEFGYNAFEYCIKLNRITLPLSLTVVQTNAFDSHNSVENIYFEGTIEQWNNHLKKMTAFKYFSDDCIVHCSDGDINIR